MSAPVIFQVVGDQFIQPSRIQTILWEGNTTANDVAEIKDKQTGEVLWAGRTNSTSTYLGASFAPFNIPTQGFRCSALTAGRLLIYLAQAI